MLLDDTISAPVTVIPSAAVEAPAAPTAAVAAQTQSLRIDLEPAYRVDSRGNASGHGKARMFFEGKLIGESHQPAFDAARYLLANGLALPSDRLTTYREGKPCLFTVVGRAAKLAVKENPNGGFTIAAFRPFPEGGVGRTSRAGRASVAVAGAAKAGE